MKFNLKFMSYQIGIHSALSLRKANIRTPRSVRFALYNSLALLKIPSYGTDIAVVPMVVGSIFSRESQ